jgi:hypothetical protein
MLATAHRLHLKCDITNSLFFSGGQASSEAPVAMGDLFLQHYNNMTSEDFGLLFSMYSLPNLPLVFLWAVVLDRVGPNISGVFFNFIILVTQIVITYSYGNFTTLLVAFSILGVGASSLGREI